MRSRLAFDPGKRGGWAYMEDSSLIEWGRMPTTKTKPPQYDFKALHKLFSDYKPDLCVIEKVNAHACPNTSAAFSLGGCLYMLCCLAGINGVSTVMVSPTGNRGWPQTMVSGSDKKDKLMHQADAARLFPNVYDDMQIKKNDGIADAILMAEWSRRKNL